MLNYSFHIVKNSAHFIAMNDNQASFTIQKQDKPGLYTLLNDQSLQSFPFVSDTPPIPDSKWKSGVVKITPKTKPKTRSLIIQLFNYLLCDQMLHKVSQSLNTFLSNMPSSEKKVIVFSHPLVYCPQMNSSLPNDVINLLHKIKLEYTKCDTTKCDTTTSHNHNSIMFVQPTNHIEPWVNVLPLQTNLLQTVDPSYLSFLIEKSTKVSHCECPSESMA